MSQLTDVIPREKAEAPFYLGIDVGGTGIKFGISFTTKFLNQGNALVNVYTDGTVQVSTVAPRKGTDPFSTWSVDPPTSTTSAMVNQIRALDRHP